MEEMVVGLDEAEKFEHLRIIAHRDTDHVTVSGQFRARSREPCAELRGAPGCLGIEIVAPGLDARLAGPAHNAAADYAEADHSGTNRHSKISRPRIMMDVR